MQRPRALDAAAEAIVAGGGPGRWSKFSEEWYWDQLLQIKPFRSVYEEEPGSLQPLIFARPRNLSQTPREQCELEGLVREGLDRGGAGQEVELHGLTSCPELNGQRGRVLPLSGAGAPERRCDAGRIAVRLAGGGREVAVRPENLRSPHVAAGAGAAEAAEQPQPRQQQPQRAEALQLLEAEFRLWRTGATLKPTDLRKGGLQEQHIRCCACGVRGDDVERYVALKRTAPLSSAPLPGAALHLLCLGCYADSAATSGMPLTADGIQQFCEQTMMGAMEACMQIMGYPRMHWGGPGLGSGALY